MFFVLISCLLHFGIVKEDLWGSMFEYACFLKFYPALLQFKTLDTSCKIFTVFSK